MFVNEGKVGNGKEKVESSAKVRRGRLNQLSEKTSAGMSCLSCNLAEKEPARRRAPGHSGRRKQQVQRPGGRASGHAGRKARPAWLDSSEQRGEQQATRSKRKRVPHPEVLRRPQRGQQPITLWSWPDSPRHFRFFSPEQTLWLPTHSSLPTSSQLLPGICLRVLWGRNVLLHPTRLKGGGREGVL